MNKYNYNGKIITADSKEEAIKQIVAGNNIKNFDEYKKKFDEYWKPNIDSFKKSADKLSNIEYSIWLTDCDDEYNEFAKWAFDNGYPIESAPISVDWWIKSTGDSESDSALRTLIENIILKEIYDTMSSSPFWREDYFAFTKDILSSMKAANDLVSAYKEIKG